MNRWVATSYRPGILRIALPIGTNAKRQNRWSEIQNDEKLSLQLIGTSANEEEQCEVRTKKGMLERKPRQGVCMFTYECSKFVVAKRWPGLLQHGLAGCPVLTILKQDKARTPHSSCYQNIIRIISRIGLIRKSCNTKVVLKRKGSPV